MGDERDDTDSQGTDTGRLSCRPAFLGADFFAHMLDYQAVTTGMLKKIRAAQIASEKAVKAGREPDQVNDYLGRMKKGRRRLELQRALSDEELEEIRHDLENMPASVRRHLTDEAQTGATESADPGPGEPPTGPRFSP